MSIQKIKIPQIVLGLLLVLFGLNGVFSFLPIPEKQGFAFEFLHTLHEAKYLFPIVYLIMTTTGTLLLLNKWVAFGLLVQLPVSFNILAFHLFHDFQALPIALAMFNLNMLLIFSRSNEYKFLFQ
ncbi:MAG: DoxX protein [Parachlamydiaceae bacterium]